MDEEIEYHNEEEWKKWIKNLKVGDIVCDCRYKHLKIVAIHDTEIGDRDVTLEDGANCSAIHCLESSKHSWEHPDV